MTSAETEFEDVHNAYKQYIDEHNTEPTNPTQFLKYCQKKSIPNINWSKTNQYFKLFRDPKSSIASKTQKQAATSHKKTPSDPLTTNGASFRSSTDSSHLHKRSQSLMDTKTHKNQIMNEKKSFTTVHLNELLTELKEESSPKQNDDDSKSDTLSTKSFRSILIDQKLPPLSATHEAASSIITIEKSAPIGHSKHKLLRKPWNKNKPSNWPKERMQMTHDLKQWLKQHKFDKFAAKLYHYGVESMDDLRLLSTEDIIEELCGKNGVQMTIIYRRKFIQQIMALNTTNAFNRNDGDDESRRQYADVSQFKYETQAVQALASRMQAVTTTLRATKQLQSETEKQTTAMKQSVMQDFDALIKMIALRKKRILQAIDTRHNITVRRLQEQYTSLSETAVCLLQTKQCIAPQIKETKASEERTEFVIDTVQSCFEQCDKHTPSDFDYLLQNDLIYEQGSNETMDETLEAFGKVIFNEEQIV